MSQQDMTLDEWEKLIGVPRNTLLQLAFLEPTGFGVSVWRTWRIPDLSVLIDHMRRELESTRRRHGQNRAKMRAVLPALEEAWLIVRFGASGDDKWRSHGEEEHQEGRGQEDRR